MHGMTSVAAAICMLAGLASCSSGMRAESDGDGAGMGSAAPVGAAAAMPEAMARPNSRMQDVLTKLAELGGKPITTLSAPEARQQPTPADAVKALLTEEGKSTAPKPVGNVMDRVIPGPGGPLPVRVYTPEGSGPFPVVVYFHGGGWVIANLDTYDASARALADGARAVVMSVAYRQAPEHKFPAAHQDAFAAYKWALSNAGDIHGDSAKVAVAGESAGGNLAGAVSLMARDSGVTMPVYQVLVYPIANYDFSTESYREDAMAKPLNKAMMQWFFEKYLRTPADGASPLISLVDAPDLHGLPPATVITDQIDPLRTEGQMYAERLKEAGVEVDVRTYMGVTHECFGMGAVLPEAREAVAQASAGLKKGFNASP